MAYADVLNLEYRSEKIRNCIRKNGAKKFKGFPDAISRTIIKSGPTSEMMMAVYETGEFTEKDRSLATKF